MTTKHDDSGTTLTGTMMTGTMMTSVTMTEARAMTAAPR